jgi:hypothetical protein
MALLQGTLELLVLRTLILGPRHGRSRRLHASRAGRRTLGQPRLRIRAGELQAPLQGNEHRGRRGDGDGARIRDGPGVHQRPPPADRRVPEQRERPVADRARRARARRGPSWHRCVPLRHRSDAIRRAALVLKERQDHFEHEEADGEICWCLPSFCSESWVCRICCNPGPGRSPSSSCAAREKPAPSRTGL